MFFSAGSMLMPGVASFVRLRPDVGARVSSRVRKEGRFIT